MANYNINNKEYKEIYDKDNNLILKLKRPVWTSDETVNICYGCRQYFSPFRRKHHCRNCGNIFCQNCSSSNTALPFLGYHRFVRVCKRCSKIVEFLNKSLDSNCSIVDKINNEYDMINIILNGDENTIHHFVNYGGIPILNYFCTLKHPAFCHVFVGIILAHMTKFELSEQNNKDLIELFIKLSNLYIENMDKISLDTQYLLFLLQNLVIFLMDILVKTEISNITEGNEIEIVKILLNFSYLKPIYKKIHMENFDNQHYTILVTTIEKIVSKGLSEFCKKKEHQYALFQHPEVFDLFYRDLVSSNDESRKYIAKSLAYLSLRNDQYKILILKGSGKVPVKDHVDTLVDCIILDPEKFPDILNSFCNCCYTEYLKEIEEAKNDPNLLLSHSYSPKKSSFHKMNSHNINLKNNNNNYNLKHSRHSSSSSTPGSPIIKKQLNLSPTIAPVSNLTKGLNSSHYRTIPTSPLSRSSISSNFDEILTPPSSATSMDASLNGTPSSSPTSFEKLSLNETKNRVEDRFVLDENMIKKLKFEPDTLFSTNILNSYLNEHQNHTSYYNHTHDLASYNTMISHVVCTLANLICQADCEEIIMENDQAVFGLCLLIEYHVKLITNSLQNKHVSISKLSTSLDIARHASRALGNIALNQNNIEVLFSLCTTKQPHIISALYSLLSLNDETIQRQTLRIVSNIYSKKSINDLTIYSETINSNLDTIQALIPQDQDTNSTNSNININNNINNNNNNNNMKNNNNNNNNNNNSNSNNNMNINKNSDNNNNNNNINVNKNSNPNNNNNPNNSNNNNNNNNSSPTVIPKKGTTSPNSLSINTNLNIRYSSSPKKMNESINESISPTDDISNQVSKISLDKEEQPSSPVKSVKSMDRNSYISLPPLFDDGSDSNTNSNNNNNNNNNNVEHPHKLLDKEFRRSSLQLHLNLTAPVPINNNVMMNINPDSVYFLYHIKYILRFITIVNYCKDYGCSAEVKRKAATVQNKLKVIVKNYSSNIKKLNQI
jgi:hypothetical protein